MHAPAWAYCWAATRDTLIGHDPSVDEDAEWWKESRRTAFREQAVFREAFPMLDSPAAIYDDPDIRASLARHAEVAGAIEAWIAARRNGRDRESVRAMMAPDRLPT